MSQARNPKRLSAETEQRLATQLKNLNISFTDDFQSALNNTNHVVDAIFGTGTSTYGNNVSWMLNQSGFSFAGEVREPFSSIIEALTTTSVPVTSVDAPSSWNIEDGPPLSGAGKDFHPAALVSLTAPKPLIKHFRGRHFLGGR